MKRVYFLLLDILVLVLIIGCPLVYPTMADFVIDQEAGSVAITKRGRVSEKKKHHSTELLQLVDLETMKNDPEESQRSSFITKWTVKANGEIIIPINIKADSLLMYNYNVDWGDGTEYTEVVEDARHVYTNTGTYEVAISGEFPAIRFYEGDQNTKNWTEIQEVVQWGTTQWQTMEGAFAGCINLIISAQDIPDLSRVKDMSFMFQGNENFNQDISSWDVSNVENMRAMFWGAKNFNQPLSLWGSKLGNVKDMSFMFQENENFNQDISSWDVLNVENMKAMFLGAKNFNQDISSWDVSNVENMSFMFFGAKNFNQDISSWDVSNVENMKAMFSKAKNFNQPLSLWGSKLGNVKDMSFMFQENENFNQDISSWDVLNVENMKAMFLGAKNFNQDISSWEVKTGVKHNDFWTGSTAESNGNQQPKWK